MRCLLFFSLVLLLALCIDGKTKLKGSGRHSHFFKGKHESRALQVGACSIDCSALGVGGGSWVINLANLGITVAYSASYSALAIINFNIDLAVILVSGFFGIFNIKSGVGFLVNTSNGLGMFVTNIAGLQAVFFGATLDIIGGIGILAGILAQNAALIVSTALGTVFNISTVIFGLLGLSLTAFIAAISTSIAVGTYITAYFYNLVVGLLAFFASSTYDAALGVYNLIGAIVGSSYAVLASAFTALGYMFISSVSLSSQILFSLVYNLLYFVDAIIAGQILAVKLANMVWEFFGAGGTLLFSVTIDGLVIVGDVVKGSISSFSQVMAGISYGGFIQVQNATLTLSGK